MKRGSWDSLCSFETKFLRLLRAMDTVVPVYTVSDESRYLIVKNVPALGCIEELVKLFGTYGPIEEYRLMDEEECEPFTDIYWLKFVNISNARFAKRKLDNFNFLGNLIDVNYAPAYETLLDTQEKLEERRNAILSRLKSEKQGQPRRNLQHGNRAPMIPPEITGYNQPQIPLKLPGQQLPSHTEANTASVDATVQAVRRKLDQISNVPTVSQAIQYSKALASGNDSTTQTSVHQPPEKKHRTDNRRRI